MARIADALHVDFKRDHYFELVQKFHLRHLRTDEELDDAIKVVDSLISRPLDPGEQDYLDILTDIIEKYETDVHPMPPASDADLLRYLIDAKGITQTSLAAAIKVSNSVISEVLSGKRQFTRKQVGAVSSYFGIAVNAFSFSD